MDGTKPYHHGDLRTALLDAAEAELEAGGLEAFSLRKVARRAGVSHAAPAHHFGDVNGLLTALAARGYARLLELCDARDTDSDGTDRGPMRSYGLAYCDFARQHKALFRLCFSSVKPDHADAELSVIADEAFSRLTQRVDGMFGVQSSDCTLDGMIQSYRCWALCHGIADLLASDRLKLISELPATERDNAILSLLEAAEPQG